MLGNINELIQQLIAQQRGLFGGVPPGNDTAAPVPAQAGLFRAGPLSLLAQQMAAGSMQAPIGTAGTPGGQSVPGFGNVRTPGAPRAPNVPTPFIPPGGGNLAFNPFQQNGGIFGRIARPY